MVSLRAYILYCPFRCLLALHHLIGSDLNVCVSDTSFIPTANNSELFDHNSSNQTLTQTDIDKLKKQGLKGEQLIKIIAQHSKTFEKKTEFSQEKYLKKKKKKFGTGIRVLKPTLQLLIEYHFGATPRKIEMMRADSLGVLLTNANIRAGGNTIVVESAGGLALAAVAERHGGHGIILNVHESSSPALDMCQKLNLPPHVTACIVHVQMSQFHHFVAGRTIASAGSGGDSADSKKRKAEDDAEDGGSGGGGGGGDEDTEMTDSKSNTKSAANKPQSKAKAKASGISFANASAPTAAATATTTPAPAPAPAAGGSAKSSSAAPAPTTFVSSRKRAPEEKAKHRASKQAMNALAYAVLPSQGGAGFDSVVIASRFSAQSEAILKVIAPYLSGSASIGIYSSKIEGLARIHSNWKNREQAARDQTERDGTELDVAGGTTEERSSHHKRLKASPATNSASAATANNSDSLVGAQLTECWYREQQVLPNRTHPLMQMSATGGYVLGGLLCRSVAAGGPTATAATATNTAAGAAAAATITAAAAASK